MEKQTIIDRLESFNEQLNLTHYWIILLKYKKILLLLPVFFGLLGYLIGLNIKPIFESNATMVIKSGEKNIINIQEVYESDRAKFTNTYINNQIEILRSDEIANRILSNKEIVQKLARLYNTIPESYFTKNIKAIKKLLFFDSKNFVGEKKLSGILTKNYQ